jgi:hypothetical protein
MEKPGRDNKQPGPKGEGGGGGQASLFGQSEGPGGKGRTPRLAAQDAGRGDPPPGGGMPSPRGPKKKRLPHVAQAAVFRGVPKGV